MVRKSGKAGIRTGNTLRATSSRHYRTCQAESCIIRKSSNLSRRQINEAADDELLAADGVVYSLNKKGRWTLPTIIRDSITQEDGEVTISMYKRHKMNRQANCVEFYCNKGKVKSVVPERGYFNATSVRRATPANSDGEDGQLPDPEPEIRYDVFYPSPVSSSISHNRKYILSSSSVTVINGVVRAAGKYRRKGGNRQRMRENYEDHILDFVESDSFDDRQSENAGNDSPNDDFTAIHSPEVTLIDILEAAERARELCVDKGRRRKIKVKKTKSLDEEAWVIVDKQIEGEESFRVDDDEANVTSDISPTPTLESVRILLQYENSRPDSLQEIFQDRYTECNCRPRKFIIDTTKVLHDALKHCKLFNSVFLASLDLTSCMIFSREANYDTGIDVYGVQINIISSLKKIRLETLFDLMHTTVENAVQAAAQFVTTLPLDTFKKIDVPVLVSSRENPMTFQLTSTINKWNSQSVQLHEITPCSENDFEVVSADDVQGAAAAAAATTAEGGDVGSGNTPRAVFCNICFEEIDPELMVSASSTALLACFHWFCDGCWKEHISERIYSGAVTISCPEHGCDSIVDSATILSLVNIKHARLLQRQNKTLEVEKSANLKWCPNPRCGRVLQTSSTSGEHCNVTCGCGHVVCFACLGGAHWPASCEQATGYKKKLLRNSDEILEFPEMLTNIAVRGKFCPKCNRFIEKNGGCKYMSCVCSFQFCWTCLHEWSTHGGMNRCFEAADLSGTKKEIISHIRNGPTIPSARTNMYKLAVANRTRRAPRMVRALQSDTNSLSAQLQVLLAKRVDIGADSDATRSPTTAAEVHEFLLQMMLLKLELNHVIEHTAVLLDGRMIQSGSRKMAHICERLESISTSIESDLSRTGRREVLRALPSLAYLRRLARRGVTALVSHLSTFGPREYSNCQ